MPVKPTSLSYMLRVANHCTAPNTLTPCSSTHTLHNELPNMLHLLSHYTFNSLYSNTRCNACLPTCCTTCVITLTAWLPIRCAPCLPTHGTLCISASSLLASGTASVPTQKPLVLRRYTSCPCPVRSRPLPELWCVVVMCRGFLQACVEGGRCV